MINAGPRYALGFVCFCLGLAAYASPIAGATSNASRPTVHMLRDHLMVVSVSINERGPFDFLVDTGSNTTLVDSELAAELDLKPVDRMLLASLANSAAVPRYFLQSFKIGAASVSNLEALAAPLVQLHALDRHIRGVVGMNFLLQFSFRLDYQHKSLELFVSPEDAPAVDGRRVPVEINDSRILIAVTSKAAPGGRWNLALDSGISQFLVFQDRISAQSDRARCDQGSCLMHVSTNLADQTARTVLLRDLSIAGTQLPNLTVVVLRNDLIQPSDPEDGLIPASLFQSVFFDRRDASVVLCPN